MIRSWFALSFFAVAGLAGLASAAEPAATETPAEPGATETPAPSPQASSPESRPPGDAAASVPAPAAAPPAPADANESYAATAGVPMMDASEQAPSAARYGLGVRARWVSVPSWLLGLFLTSSVPLNSYTIGGEFFRRSGNFDFVLGLAWQSLSPSDGNWLGKGSQSSTDTNFVQFRGLGAVSFDAAFILRTNLNDFVSLHYGGGVGIGITTGKMLRTSDGSPGCATEPGNVTACYPIVPGCTAGPCTESQLRASEGGTNSPATPSRVEDNHIPPVYPIVNLVTGLDFRIPSAPGLELKLEGGFFFPYFFLGGGATYRI